MSRVNENLVIISNRLPITVQKKPDGQFKIVKSSGGLVAGLDEIHRQKNTLWVGHSGLCRDEVANYSQLEEQLKSERLYPVDLTATVYNSYYDGACNSIIWPLFHYLPESMDTIADDWKSYEAVNQSFAETILTIVKPNDQVWIHDYQLMLLPGLLRKQHPNLSIAYFHHIPFPSSEIFRILQSRESILDGLLGADIIGFHTSDYVRHFLISVTRILGLPNHLDEVHYRGRRVRIVAQPLGVDVNMIQAQSAKKSEKTAVSKLATEIGNRTVLLGIDRLDYTKGIPERLLAFRRFLQHYPDYVGKVTLIQIAVPSRAHVKNYCKLRAVVERLVGQINGEFAAPGYTPVQYLYRSFPKEDIIAFYQLAKVALITPLRDGLNLVCKEYVAAHDDEDGVIILSEMAGAAAEMGEALLVNPYDIDSFVEAMHTALTMTQEKRQQRMRRLRQKVIQTNNLNWMRNFIHCWREAVTRNHKYSMSLTSEIQTQLLRRIALAQRCFIFISCDLSSAFPLDLNLLEVLSQNQKIELVLMTRQERKYFSAFEQLPVHLVADHGAFIKLKQQAWETQAGVEEFVALEADIIRLLEGYTQHVLGSYIECKEFSIRWHYGQADVTFACSQARELCTSLGQLLENTHFSVYLNDGFLEIRHIVANKGHAIEQILKNLQWKAEEVLITIGGNEDDEEMYQIFPENNWAIHIGAPNLSAKYQLATANQLNDLLKDIVKEQKITVELRRPGMDARIPVTMTVTEDSLLDP